MASWSLPSVPGSNRVTRRDRALGRRVLGPTGWSGDHPEPFLQSPMSSIASWHTRPVMASASHPSIGGSNKATRRDRALRSGLGPTGWSGDLPGTFPIVPLVLKGLLAQQTIDGLCPPSPRWRFN